MAALLSDTLFSDFDRSDFIGGIDNEVIDLNQLDQYCIEAAAVGSIGETNNHNSHNNTSGDSASFFDPKTEAPTTPPSVTSDAKLPITTISARVSLTSTPIATPLCTGGIGTNHNTPHLPESPPDSGSEPPYSPLQDVHGLTLTSRDIYHALSPLHQPPVLHELHMQPQFTPPQAQYQHNNNNNSNGDQRNFQHNLQSRLNTTSTQDHTIGIRVKPDVGLLMNSAGSAQQLPRVNPPLLTSQTHNGAHTELATQHHQQLMYPSLGANSALPYDAVSNSFFESGPTYQAVTSTEPTHPFTLPTLSNVPRVEVIGTSQVSHIEYSRTSAPSSPVHHSSSRKRKLSSQIDCADYANLKPSPGFAMSPTASAHGLPHRPLTAELLQKRSPTSPISLNLPAHGNNDLGSTPAHSTASLSPTPSTVHSNSDASMDCNGGGNGAGQGENGDNADANSITPCIRFSPFQPQNWHQLCDQNLQDLAVVYYRVDADKGFNFSVSDDAFVCQKKNHFQVTCHARLQGDAKFVKTPSGMHKITSFHLHFYGVKYEAPNQTIRVEQSQSDRSKKPFYPVPIDLQSHIVSKVTVGRLHFSETTNNNMRKKGRPNPEQRYFQLVVGLHVHTISGNFPIISQASERIIVRASNPGQFESDVDLCWQRGITQDSICHMGRVGINTDRPDESLVVNGNLKISGHIVQPSDSRAKQEIAELDTSVQLRNMLKIRVVRYCYQPDFAIHSGLKRASQSDTGKIIDTGVIAQEVREVIPDAVQEAGSIELPNGVVIDNFLMVKKDRLLMETIGAVKEIGKRLEDLERGSNSLKHSNEGDEKSLRNRIIKQESLRNGYEMCSNRALQIIIFLLIIVMAACLTAVSTLYFVEHNKPHHNYKQFERLEVHSNGRHVGHDTLLISEKERPWNQPYNMFNINKTHIHGPNWHFSSSPPPVPAKNSTRGGQELTYNDSDEIFSTHGRNDELRVIVQKPLGSVQALSAHKEPYRMTTTAPAIRNNKTINSKHKSKWPSPQTVLRTMQAQAHQQLIPQESNVHVITVPPPPATVHEVETEDVALNSSKTSSEKAGDAIPLPQDFENNSIDIDAQHVTKKATGSSKTPTGSRLTAALINNAEQEPTLVVESGDTDITLKLSDHLADTITSTSSSNSITVLTPTSTAHQGVYTIYETVAPPISNTAVKPNSDTNNDSNGQISYSIETPPTSNKSQGVLDSTLDSLDAIDLQSLGSNNDSADNPMLALFGFGLNGGRGSPLGRRSATQRSIEWLTRKIVETEVFGAPAQCTQKTTRDDVSNCQSVCFEDSNQLPALHQINLAASPKDSKKITDTNQQQNVDNIDIDTDEADADSDADVDDAHLSLQVPPTNTSRITAGKTAHSTQSISKQSSAEQQSGDADTLDSIQDHSLSAEQLELEPPNKADKNSPITPTLSVEAPVMDCWKISSDIYADGMNQTLGTEQFCPNNGKTLNLTYIIPLSKFFKEPSIELHLSSSMPLLWTICRNCEHTKRNGELLVNSAAYQLGANTLQRRRNSSQLFLTIPSRGYFMRDLALRASSDLEKQNICQEKAHEANSLLQYNFRIIRDCD